VKNELIADTRAREANEQPKGYSGIVNGNGIWDSGGRYGRKMQEKEKSPKHKQHTYAHSCMRMNTQKPHKI
jgi:hypothetical protein